MEAYDAAVLSYALATAAHKIKPGLLGIAPNIPTRNLEDSLTPPAREGGQNETKNYLHQLLYNVEQLAVNKSYVQVAHLLEICSTKETQWEPQILTPLEALQCEVKKVCKSYPKSLNSLKISFEGDDKSTSGICLENEIISKSLIELLNKFGFTIGASLLKKSLK
ncbi:unnamed protein product [Brassicogethes aeneus]|uniref:Uncharacterized protein n=1 Tax=Brassicogethes aeneus TaxID=1431903 RepID=A0A9P0FGR8_BRAAE|nr:unnamed protein product [Brassicogethes aeneus]